MICALLMFRSLIGDLIEVHIEVIVLLAVFWTSIEPGVW